MKVVFEAQNQGNIIRLYHHGYLEIVPAGPHFGFQLDDTLADALIQAMHDYVPGYGPGEGGYPSNGTITVNESEGNDYLEEVRTKAVKSAINYATKQSCVTLSGKGGAYEVLKAAGKLG